MYGLSNTTLNSHTFAWENKRKLFDELKNLGILNLDELYNICLVNEGIRPGFLTHYRENKTFPVCCDKVNILSYVLTKYNMKFVLQDNKYDETGKEYYIVKNNVDISNKPPSEILGFLCDENQFFDYNQNRGNGYSVQIMINNSNIISYVCCENIIENNEKIQKITKTVKQIDKYSQEIEQNNIKCYALIHKTHGFLRGETLLMTIN